MVRLAVSGTHQVGKSTLISALGGEVCTVGGIMRGLLADGFPVGAATTPRTIGAYVTRQQGLEIAHRSHPRLMSDRVLADGVAYVVAARDGGLATYPWSDSEIELLVAAAKLHALWYDIQIVVPIEFDIDPTHSFHEGGARFRQEVGVALTQLLEDWPIPVVEVSGSVAERAEQVRSLPGWYHDG